MNISLIKYNISYYAKTLKFIAPVLVFTTVHLYLYSRIPVPIWSNFYLTAIIVFIFTNWIGTSFINSEDRTQQYITRLHINNETIYHISKIVSILVLMTPFYILLIFYPIVFGFFVRSLLFIEILAMLIIHFMFSLMGTAVSIFFNVDFHNQKTVLPLQALVILVIAVPFAVTFEDNVFVQYITYLLPPINFLGQRLHDLDNGIFILDNNFLIFILYSLGYSLALIVIYILLIRNKNKH